MLGLPLTLDLYPLLRWRMLRLSQRDWITPKASGWDKSAK